MFSKGSPPDGGDWSALVFEWLFVLLFWTALTFGFIWGVARLTQHLKARRTGSNPHSWQTDPKADIADVVAGVGEGRWQQFWTDLKATATKPYGQKTTLEKAYGACVLLLVAAALPMPYEYYVGMRMGVCIALYFFGLAAYAKRPLHGAWFFCIVILIVLYNPIVPFHFGVQLVWTAINAATIYALFRAKLALDRPAQGPSETTV